MSDEAKTIDDLRDELKTAEATFRNFARIEGRLTRDEREEKARAARRIEEIREALTD